MIIIKNKSNNAVIFTADSNLTLDEFGVYGVGWMSRICNTDNATLEIYEGDLPEGFLGNSWSYDGTTWAILEGAEDRVAEEINRPIEARKVKNAATAQAAQDEAIAEHALNTSKKTLGLTPEEPDETELATYVQALEADIQNPPSDEVYHPPVHPGVVVPSVGIDITMTREVGWNDTLGWRLVFDFDEADYVPANLAITVYSSAECTGYLYTPGALQLDPETGKYFALCPAGQEGGDVDYFFGLVYGSAELACWTFTGGVTEETINVI